MRKIAVILLFVVSTSMGKAQENLYTTAELHEYVDLGLSVKWATCNVGANTPEEFGDYFAWGETAPKSEYTWSSYTYCTDDEGKKFSKYVLKKRQGDKDGKNTLDLSDDAAHVNWGDNWRMPTSQEVNELCQKCQFVLEEMNGVMGYRVYSRVNKNSIFIPFAGSYSTDIFNPEGGAYWTSNLVSKGNLFDCGSTIIRIMALRYHFDGHSNFVGIGDAVRCLGMSVRPVWDSEVGRDVIWNSSKGDFVFFTENNKPEEYIIHNPDFPTSSVSNSYYENKIGEARANNMNDIIEQGIKWNFNGAILLKSTTRTFFEDPMHGIVTQQYIPIIYDQEKYPSSKSSKKISK